MAQAEPVQHASDSGAMHRYTTLCQLNAQFVQRQVTVLGYALSYPSAMVGQFTATEMTLPSRRQRSCLALQDNQVIHEPRRHPEMARRLPVGISFLNKRNNTGTQLNRFPMPALLPASKESEII
jgi:hypothetical protein